MVPICEFKDVFDSFGHGGLHRCTIQLIHNLSQSKNHSICYLLITGIKIYEIWCLDLVTCVYVWFCFLVALIGQWDKPRDAFENIGESLKSRKVLGCWSYSYVASSYACAYILWIKVYIVLSLRYHKSNTAR